MVMFTSDLHLGHKTIVEKHRTEFSSIEEHDNMIFDQFALLSKRDIAFVLGDFIFDCKNYEHYVDIFKKFSCRIKLVMGNHDSLKLYREQRFEVQSPLFSYKNNWISHCPIHPQEMRNKDINIHGHVHKNIIKDIRYVNVNIDVNDYRFLSFDEIKGKQFNHRNSG